MERSVIESIENTLLSDPHIGNLKVSDRGRLSQADKNFCQKWDFQFLLPEMVCASLRIDSDFPHSWPEIFIGKKYFCEWPHVEKNGKLCLFRPSEISDQSDERRIIACAIKRAYDLLRDSIKRENTADFRDEMHSYWEQCAPHRTSMRIISIVKSPFKTKIVSAYWAKSFVLLADNPKQAKQWLTNYYDCRYEAEYKFSNSIFVDIGKKIICPRSYPKNGNGFLRLLEDFDIDIDDEIQRAFTDLPPFIIIGINVETKHGDCLVALIQKTPAIVNLCKGGFRKISNLPLWLFKNRIFGLKLQNKNIERADVSWVHGRDRNRDAVDDLSGKTVTIIGCGSVGSSVAELLLKSGVGKMYLIDGDDLSTANVSRHVLGMDSTGKNKSLALHSAFRKSYPHATIKAYSQNWDRIEEKEIRKVFQSSDLILELTADKFSLQKLNIWHANENKRNTPIIYGYTENHAAAGFCITIGQNGGDIECALDKWGRYALKITKWPDDDIHQEAGCGAEFASYGAIELQYTTGLIARKAVEVLLQPYPLTSEIKCWVADKKTVVAAGGQWTKQWKDHPSFRDEGFITFSEEIEEDFQQCA